MIPAKMIHRKLFAALLLIVLIFDLTGCGPQATVMPATPSATEALPTATSTIAPTITPIPTDTSTPFVPKATIKIASQSPLSGDLAVGGTDIMRGVELAIRQLADPLMELGYKIELSPSDDQNDFGAAVAVAKEIVADPEILCGVGPYSSRVFNQVEEIYHQAGLAFVSPSTTGAFVTESRYLEVNRVVGRNDGEGAAGGHFAKTQGFARVFIISQNTDPARFIAKNFRNQASRLGLTVVGDMSTEALKKFDRLIDRVISNNADLVYFSTLSVEQAGGFFREARAAGYKGALMGPSSLDTPSLLEFAGPLLIEGGGAYYTNVVLSASGYPAAVNFVDDFETLYGVRPQNFSAQAYDAAGVCLKAIEEASKGKAGEIPTRAEVANAIRALQDYKGITGTYNFNRNGDPDPAKYFVFEVVSADPDDWNQNTLITSFEVAPPE
ncbi:MAG TPA: branched-chain amino acid ABC transporter substrate-binding protein [Anaerolineales bacterium]|nr:branched-chain amino acid ABC transporter substrate-binding protein [Anaerolineales bacterium]